MIGSTWWQKRCPMRLPDRLVASKRSTTVFWLLTVLFAVLLTGGLGLPVVKAFADQAAAIHAAREQLDTLARVRLRADAIAGEEKTLKALGEDSGDLLSGATDPLAGAELQTRFASTVQDIGARLISTQILPADAEGPGFRRISVRGMAAVTAAQLRDLLHALEAGRPRLLIAALAIRTADPLGIQMEVNLDVVGYRADSAP